MSKKKKNKLVGKEKEFRNYVLNSTFDPLFLLNQENLKIRDLTNEENQNQNITYIAIDLWLKKIDIAFWNNQNKIIDNNIDNFNNIINENIQYTRSEFNSNSLPYELIKDVLKKNIKPNANIRLVIELPSLKNDQSKEKAATLTIIKSFKNLLNEIDINNQIKIINHNSWINHYGYNNHNFNNKNNEATLIVNKAHLIWTNAWNPFFLNENNTRRTFKNISEPNEAEILNLLSNTYKDKIYDEEDNLDNITYVGIDLGLKKTGFAFLNYPNNDNSDIDYFDHINSKNLRYDLNDLKPNSEPYEKIKEFFNKYIKKDSFIRIIIEIPQFKKDEKREIIQRDFIIETFNILLDELKNKYEIKLIYAHDWRVYYIEYDSIFDESNKDNIFSLDKTNKIKKISHNLTDINNDDEAEAILIVNKSHKIWNNTK